MRTSIEEQCRYRESKDGRMLRRCPPPVDATRLQWTQGSFGGLFLDEFLEKHGFDESLSFTLVSFQGVSQPVLHTRRTRIGHLAVARDFRLGFSSHATSSTGG